MYDGMIRPYIAFLASIALYYCVLTRVFDRIVLCKVLERRSIGDESVPDVLAAVDITVAAVFQGLIIWALCIALRLDIQRLMMEGLHPSLFIIAPLLALAELAAASMLASFFMSLAVDVPGKNWGAMMESGWVRSFILTSKRGNAGLALVGISIYIGCEEILFRGVGIAAFADLGPVAAGVASTLTFIAVQAVGMPSMKHALFPICGAAVMGPVHSILAISFAPLLFLIAVHLMFFFAALAAAPHLTTKGN